MRLTCQHPWTSLLPYLQFCLLGAPLSALEVALEKRCSELSLGLSRLPELARHDAIILFRSSLSSSKLLHTLRCFPCMGHPLLNRFDQILQEGLTNSLNVALADCNWDQATLSIRDGGLSIRRVSSLALPAFLASAAGTASLQASILSSCNVPDDLPLVLGLEQWSAESGAPVTELSLAHKQSALDKPHIKRDLAALMTSTTSEYH